jgi:hypothetical protein
MGISLSGADATGLTVYVIMGAACIAVLSAPLEMGVAVFVAYTGVAGILKALVDYSPVAHLSNDLLLVCLTLSFVTRSFGRGSFTLRRIPYRVPMTLLVVSSVLLTFAPWTTPIQALGGWKAYVVPLVLVPISISAFDRAGSTKWVTRAIVAIGVSNAVAGLVEGAVGPTNVGALGPAFFRLTHDAGTSAFIGAVQLWRPFGLAQDAGTAALIEAVALVVVSIQILRNARSRAPFLVIGGLLLSGILLGGVRAAVAIAVVGIVVGVMLDRRAEARRRTSVVALGTLAILMLIGFVVVTGASNAVVQSRIGSLGSIESLQASRGSLILEIPATLVRSPFGVGMGKSVPASGLLSQLAGVQREAYASENMFLAMTLELGVLGLMFTTLFWSLLGKVAFEHWARRSMDNELLVALAVCSGMFAGGFAGPVFGAQPANVFVWVFASVAAVRLNRMVRESVSS